MIIDLPKTQTIETRLTENSSDRRLKLPKIQRIEDSFLQSHPNEENYKFDKLLWFHFVSDKMDKAIIYQKTALNHP